MGQSLLRKSERDGLMTYTEEPEKTLRDEGGDERGEGTSANGEVLRERFVSF